MINAVVLEDEITLYWDKQWDVPDGVSYKVACNGKAVTNTSKTHYTFVGLEADTEYSFSVERLDKKHKVVEVLYKNFLRTKKARRRIDVTKPPYNAVGDGKTLNTAVLRRVLEDCKELDTVYFPKGVYLTGALDVHSDTEIYLDEGAVLLGSENPCDYLPKRRSRFEGIEMDCYSALINVGQLDGNAGYTCKNVTVRGGGKVTGGGAKLAAAVIQAEKERLNNFLEQNAEYVKTCECENTIPGRVRPRLVAINNCENATLANVELEYGAAWTVHMIYSKNVVTYGCVIRSEGVWNGEIWENAVWNGDGWNPDSSEDCAVFNTTFRTYDDAIAIKSGKNPEGNKINRPTKNIRIFDCQGKNGIAIGSELSGGISNVYIWDCKFFEGVSGFRVKTTRKRGGFVKNVKIRNCELVDFRVWTGYTCNNDGEGANCLTKLEEFYCENVRLTGVSTNPKTNEKVYVPPIMFWGFDEKEYYIQEVKIKNVQIHTRKDGELPKIQVKNVKEFSLEKINFIE